MTLSIALSVVALLLVSGFPKARADTQVGKRGGRARPHAGQRGCLGLVVSPHLLQMASGCLLVPPSEAQWGLLSASLWLAAAWLWRARHPPQRLRPALVLSVMAVLLDGAGLSFGFLLLSPGR